MFSKIYNFFVVGVLRPLYRNSAMALFLLGIVLVCVGALQLGIDPKVSEVISRLGGAILGAGVFAVIMKSAQFTELFQQHIADVIYDPHRAENSGMLMDKWRLITNALLKDVLPSTYDTAVIAIEKRYFDNELDYHFEGYEATYEIVCDKKTNTRTVTSTLRTMLVISPRKVKPIFEQKIKCDTPARLTSLIIDDKTINLPGDKLIGAGEEKILTFDLTEYANGKTSVKLERTFVTVQRQDEPFVTVTISRFIKGAVIRSKISPGYKVRFLSLGIEGYNQSASPDGNGFTRWTLAQPNSLLLPGQGYTLIFVPNS